MAEPTDEEIRELLDRNPQFWTPLREEAATNLAEAGGDVTPERVDEEAVAIFRRRSLGEVAKIQEFIPPDERRRIYAEVEALLIEAYPEAEGFPIEVMGEAIRRRLKEEYPEAFEL
jgi:hypothetical protein